MDEMENDPNSNLTNRKPGLVSESLPHEQGFTTDYDLMRQYADQLNGDMDGWADPAQAQDATES